MNAPRKFRLPRGLLVAIEGIDGAGKTTQATMLAGHLALAETPMEIVASKEPTSGPWGQKIRASAETGRLSPAEELEAFIEDRKEHVATLIAPALARGALVILDRYYFSTATYQGARGLDPEEILRTNEAFAPRPDLLIIVELDPVVSLDRVVRRGGANEFETLEGLRAVHEGFARLGEPYTIARVNGALGPQEVHRAVREAVNAALLRAMSAAAESVIRDDAVAPEDKAWALRNLLVNA